MPAYADGVGKLDKHGAGVLLKKLDGLGVCRQLRWCVNSTDDGAKKTTGLSDSGDTAFQSEETPSEPHMASGAGPLRAGMVKPGAGSWTEVAWRTRR